MAFTRRIELYDTDATTLLATLNPTHAEFELLRQGGCGAGSITVSDNLITRNIDVDQYVKMFYDNDPSSIWYFGRVEEVEYDSPSGASIRLYGLFSHLNDIVIGGQHFQGAERPPHLYAYSDWFVNDPDWSLQSWDTCSRYDQMWNLIYDQYIAPQSPIGFKEIIEASSYSYNGLTSSVYRGQETVALLIRHVAAQMNGSSFGVDENGEFFITPRKTVVIAEFQEGIDCTELKYKKDKSLQYTRLFLTGDYIYGANTPSGFYRYQATIWDAAARAQWGDKVFRAQTPWIRTDQEAFDFARGFFDQYSRPTVRVSIKTIGQTTLLRPWAGRVRVKDRFGATLITDYISRVHVTFDEIPVFDLTVGAEEPQYIEVPEPDHWELGAASGGDKPPPPTSSSSSSSSDSSNSDTIPSGGGGGGGGGCMDGPFSVEIDITNADVPALCNAGTAGNTPFIDASISGPHIPQCTQWARHVYTSTPSVVGYIQRNIPTGPYDGNHFAVLTPVLDPCSEMPSPLSSSVYVNYGGGLVGVYVWAAGDVRLEGTTATITEL